MYNETVPPIYSSEYEQVHLEQDMVSQLFLAATIQPLIPTSDWVFHTQLLISPTYITDLPWISYVWSIDRSFIGNTIKSCKS